MDWKCAYINDIIEIDWVSIQLTKRLYKLVWIDLRSDKQKASAVHMFKLIIWKYDPIIACKRLDNNDENQM